MAGTFPAGYGPGGAAPVYVAQASAGAITPRAVKYDPSVKQYVLVDNLGNPTDVHPIDQIVATRATTEQGQSQSVKTLGQRIRARWRLAQPAQKLAIAQQEVKTEFADLLNAGDIVLLSVTLATNANNANVVIIGYTNLRDPNTPPTSPRAGLKYVEA